MNAQKDRESEKTGTTLLYFAIPYCLFFAATLLMVLKYEKQELHLLLNSHHTPASDFLFRYLTHIGGTIPVIVGAILLFMRFRYGFYLLATLLFNVLITNGLKLIFKVPRPFVFFQENFPKISLPLVEGVTIHYANSFPSGHTSAVFATMLTLALISKNKYMSIIGCILVISGAYSRIYLSQHFAEDILLGSVIGCSVSLALYPLYKKLGEHCAWTNKPVQSLLSKS